MPAARLLIPVLLGALLSRADACSSNSDCSENTFCSVNSEGCMKCFWDWSDAEIKGAAQQLGVAHEGQTLMQTAQLCLQKLGHRS